VLYLFRVWLSLFNYDAIEQFCGNKMTVSTHLSAGLELTKLVLILMFKYPDRRDVDVGLSCVDVVVLLMWKCFTLNL